MKSLEKPNRKGKPTLPIERLMARPPVAREMLGVDPKQLGITPIVQRKKLTLYDVRDLYAARDLVRRTG